MENFAIQLEQQLDNLDELIRNVDRRIRACTVPENQKISVTNHNNGFQYYDVDREGRRTYLRKKNMAMVTAVVQRDYDLAVRKVMEDMRRCIERFLRQYNANAIGDVYNNLCDARKVLVNPVIQTDEAFIREWLEENRGEKNVYPENGVYLTERGEHVRSKTEKILADLFLKYNIPYAYETQLRLHNGRVFYPDFVLLNVRTRRTIYWEHFGLITDGEYAAKAMQKINVYEENGLILGENFLCSMESDLMPLDVRRMEIKVKKYLL